MAELSAGPVSAAALLNPQCQREIIEQAAGMTTRQVAGLLATAAPEIVPQRDTLRAVAPDRFTLKVSIDRECEQGLRHLKDLRSHLDPRMSWGDLVALLVREAVARHDPRRGGRRPGRAGSTEASSRRGRSRTPAVVPPAPRAGGGGGDTPVPQFASASPADRSVVALVPQSAAPAPKSARRGAADGSDAAPVPHDTAPAPNFSSGGTVDRTDVPPGSPCAAPAPELAGGVPPARGAGGAPTGSSPQVTGVAPRGPRRPPVRRPIPAAVRRHVWLRDGGRCSYRDPVTGRRCNSSHLLQIDHLLPVAEGGGPEPSNLALACFSHHRMRHGYGSAPPSEPSQ